MLEHLSDKKRDKKNMNEKRRKRKTYSCSASPATARILPVALVLDTHADLEFGVHFLDLNLEIG